MAVTYENPYRKADVEVVVEPSEPAKPDEPKPVKKSAKKKS